MVLEVGLYATVQVTICSGPTVRRPISLAAHSSDVYITHWSYGPLLLQKLNRYGIRGRPIVSR